MTPYAPAAASTAAYQQQAVLTAPPERLVVMLYDGIHRFLTQAAYAMREGDMAKARERMRRGEDIIDELLCTLNLEAGEIAVSLHSIYVYCKRQLTEALFEQDFHKIEWVRDQLAELRESWAQIAAGAAQPAAV